MSAATAMMPPPWEQQAVSPDQFPCGHKRGIYKRCLECEGRRNRIHVEQLADLIRECKRVFVGGTDPETERVMLHRLNVAMHPCPEELIKAIVGAS